MTTEEFILRLNAAVKDALGPITVPRIGALPAVCPPGSGARLEAVLVYDHPGRTTPAPRGAQTYPGTGNRLARRAAAKGRSRR